MQSGYFFQRCSSKPARHKASSLSRATYHATRITPSPAPHMTGEGAVPLPALQEAARPAFLILIRANSANCTLRVKACPCVVMEDKKREAVEATMFRQARVIEMPGDIRAEA